MTKLSETPLIHETANVTNTRLGRYTEIAEHCRIAEATIDDYSYVMEYGMIWCTTIGKFANIAANVRINATNHPLWRPTLHHFTYRSGDYWPDADTDEAFFGWRRDHAITIGHDVWIGHGATILPGVTIGNGAAIGAGAVVTKDVEPYMVVGGVAAKPIRERFSRDIAERYEKLAWWDWDHLRLRDALEDFRNLGAEAFLDRYEDMATAAA
ncbi:DapH/DapD/GlmU-related protein [Rhizobium sp. LjRoot254]|uniref:DapH/DapD/GlmU-related protein n=1 Tax=Rhizobium sp. LjRoot254 TaxID=3342297 RepID=UPI003ED1112E